MTQRIYHILTSWPVLLQILIVGIEEFSTLFLGTINLELFYEY